MPTGTISWKKQDIFVMDEVLIKSPYLTDNCVLADSSCQNLQCLNHVKKTVGSLF